jgi:hypothetical protein
MPPRLELFPFRYRDPVSRKWVKSRYAAERHVIAARYAEWEIVGPPEIRDIDPGARYFTPWKEARPQISCRGRRTFLDRSLRYRYASAVA